jgi:hypothetical protein
VIQTLRKNHNQDVTNQNFLTGFALIRNLLNAKLWIRSLLVGEKISLDCRIAHIVSQSVKT